MFRFFIIALSVMPAFVSLNVYAADNPVLSLDVSAEREVQQDHGRLTLFAEQQDTKAENAAGIVNAALDKVRNLAKQQSDFTVKSGYYSTYPIYGKDNKLAGYRVHGELIVESNNIEALSVLSGAAQPDMQVASLDFSVSPELSQKTRNELLQQAADDFAAKAQAAAKAFGYARYSYKELQLNDGGNALPRPVVAMKALSLTSESNVPLEAGKERISVSVRGTVELKK